MSSSIIADLQELLKGNHLGAITDELCDFSLPEQNVLIETEGHLPNVPSDYKPRVGKTVTYVAASVVFNENEEVLLMQEAKKSVLEKWYLPAGRVEKGESLQEAAVRECLEETGLNIQINSLILVECSGGSWFRFVFTGFVTSGTLKTLEHADKDSLQAAWVRRPEDLSLRSRDILIIIERGRSYLRKSSSPQLPQFLYHDDILPISNSHNKNYLRVIAVINKNATHKLCVLMSKMGADHFPHIEIYPQKSIFQPLRTFMLELFPDLVPEYEKLGLLSLEHAPSSTKTDGICLNLLVAFRPDLEDVQMTNTNYVWRSLTKELDGKLRRILSSKNSVIPLNVTK